MAHEGVTGESWTEIKWLKDEAGAGATPHKHTTNRFIRRRRRLGTSFKMLLHML